MAAACVAVLLIAFMLEGLRRAVKEYDRHLVRRHLRKKYRIKTGKRSVARGMDISLGNAAGFAVVDRPLVADNTNSSFILLLLRGVHHSHCQSTEC